MRTHFEPLLPIGALIVGAGPAALLHWASNDPPLAGSVAVRLKLTFKRTA